MLAEHEELRLDPSVLPDSKRVIQRRALNGGMATLRSLSALARTSSLLSFSLAAVVACISCKVSTSPTESETPESALNSLSAEVFMRALESNHCDQYFGKGYCTDYVRQNASAAPPPSGKSGGPLAWWKNPGTLSKENVPAVGAIAILNVYRDFGHTGIVRSVSDGRFTIEEWNYGSVMIDETCGVTNKFGALVKGATTFTTWSISDNRVVGFLYPPDVTPPPPDPPLTPPGQAPPAPPLPTPAPPESSSSNPTISWLSPTSRPNSDANFRMIINGAHFDDGAVDEVYRGDIFIGQGNIVSRSDARIVVDQTMTGIGVGTYTIYVRNSDGTHSNGISLEITP